MVGSVCLAIPRMGLPREAVGWVAGDVAEHHLCMMGFFEQLESGQGQPGRGRGLWCSSWAVCWVDGATCADTCVTAAPAPSMLNGSLLPSCRAELLFPRAAGFARTCFWQHQPVPRLGWGCRPRVRWRGMHRVLAFAPGGTAQAPSLPDHPPAGRLLALSLSLLGPRTGKRCVLPSGLGFCRRRDGPTSGAELHLTHASQWTLEPERGQRGSLCWPLCVGGACVSKDTKAGGGAWPTGFWV